MAGRNDTYTLGRDKKKITITRFPLDANWNNMVKAPELCEVKGIVIHYTASLTQDELAEREWWNNKNVKSRSSSGVAHDLEGHGAYPAAQFIVGPRMIIMTTPLPNIKCDHAGGKSYNIASSGSLFLQGNTSIFPRAGGDINYYTIGIEHIHEPWDRPLNSNQQMNYGRFSDATLKNSRKLCQALISMYPSIKDEKGVPRIWRHFDSTGKCCPAWYSPLLKGNHLPLQGIPEGMEFYSASDSRGLTAELNRKRKRWNALKAYLSGKGDADVIPDDLKKVVAGG